MCPASLHLSRSLKETLHSAQTDALELACSDAGFRTEEGLGGEALLQWLSGSRMRVAAVSVADLAEFAAKGIVVPAPQLLVLPTERENPALAAFASSIGSVRCVVGTSSPALLRSVAGSILDNRLGHASPDFSKRLFQGRTPELLRCTLNASSERSKLQERVMEFFQHQMEIHKEQFVNGTTGFPKIFSDVLDELLMNAIWDAHPHRAHADRTVPVQLSGKETVTVEAQCDGVNMVLSVEDNQGSFPVEGIEKPVRCALGIKPQAQINEGPGGAGLGLYMILQKVSCLAYEIEPGVRTRALAVLRGEQSFREVQKRPRTVVFLCKASL
jgi:hypothetical protein